jgi:Na+-driven multidrug efflux pump
MVIRASGGASNIVLNDVLIFGLGMNVTEVVVGTVLSEGLVTLLFSVGFLTGRVLFIGEFPIQLSLSRPFTSTPISADSSCVYRYR